MNNTSDITTTQRIAALAKHLKCDVDDISASVYDDNVFDACGGEYLVLTDDEANEQAEQYIRESLWAFDARFIASHAHKALPEQCIEALRKIQGDLCEDAAPFVEALIADMDHFVSDAVSADGRGHFISRYDGKENEEGEFYIYRTN